MHTRIPFAILVLLFSLVVVATGLTRTGAQENPPPDQLTQGAQPLSAVQVVRLTPASPQTLQQEDGQRQRDGKPPRFARRIEVNISPVTQGTWEQPAPGVRLWRLRILSPNAVSLNLGFARYKMPPGGQLFLYTPDYKQIIGPFTDADNEAHRELWTPIVPGEEVVLEVVVPANVVSQLELQLTAVNYGYRDFQLAHFAGAESSCQIDVACKMGNPWRDEMRSVAYYTTAGETACTGALINNTAQDRTPYFLTAEHCGVTDFDASSVVVYWNYQNSTCRKPGSPENGEIGDGNLNQFNTGAHLLANYVPSDMTLLRLDDPIDPAFKLYWAGWDILQRDFRRAVTIHHPSGNEKRISFDNDRTSTTSFMGMESPGDGTHIRVSDWDLGTTESGSSGSPLFNPSGRIVGQLHGGYAACDNDEPDWYGRLSVSWEGGGTPDTRLKDWLDPGNLGLRLFNGRKENDFTLQVTPSTLNVCLPNAASYAVDVTSNLSTPASVRLQVIGQPFGSKATFDPASVVTPGSSTLSIRNKQTTPPGRYILLVRGQSNRSSISVPVTLKLFNQPPGRPHLQAPAPEATDVRFLPELIWSPSQQGDNYIIQIDDDPNFTSVDYTTIVSTTKHTVAAPLATSTRYYWRVTAYNACGTGSSSTVASFTTADLVCHMSGLSIPDNNRVGIADLITFNGGGTITDLDVAVDIVHPWVGDIVATLEHVETGTRVPLVNQIGRTGLSSGDCGDNNISSFFDDDAAVSIADACPSGSPTIAGYFKPISSLSAFNGEDIHGTWRLLVSDRYPREKGTLVQWCLAPRLTFPTLEVKPSFDSPESAPGQVITYTIAVNNTGMAPATGVAISSSLPDGLNFKGPVKIAGSGGVVAEDAYDLPILAYGITIPAGQNITVTVPLRIDIGLRTGTVLSSTSKVTSIQVAAPVTGTATVTIMDYPAIAIEQRSSSDVVEVGSTITSTYDVTNTGSVLLKNVMVGSSLIREVIPVTASLEPGQSASASITYTVQQEDLPGPLLSTATVSGTALSGSVVSDTSTIAVSLTGTLLPTTTPTPGTPTAMPSNAPYPVPTTTSTLTPSSTPTGTPSSTSTLTPSSMPTGIPSSTSTLTPSSTLTLTPSSTPSSLLTATSDITPMVGGMSNLTPETETPTATGESKQLLFRVFAPIIVQAGT